MGDRAVAGFRSKPSSPTIFIYQHWVGGDQSEVLASALEAARPRWGDDSYATRICISHLIGDQWSSETGYGIYADSTQHGADYNQILIVDWSRKMVMVCENDNSDNVVGEISFDEFIANPKVQVADASLDLNAKKEEEFLARHPEWALAK
jgi:hypothetical protein